MTFNRPLTIVQISTMDQGGGAEKVARSLHEIYRAMGHRSYLVVGNKRSNNPDILQLNSGFYKILAKLQSMPGKMGWRHLWYPRSHRIPNLISQPIDIIHIHNMHGGYFDLAALPKLSPHAPTILMLHDCWLLTGHCAHPFSCERWRTGCGQCPDLSISPPILRDDTRYNWKRKRRILRKSRVWITAPSQWLLDKVKGSYLNGLPAKLVYNGVNQDIFKPGERSRARASLDLPVERMIILFSANGGLRNRWKDGGTLLQALRILIDEMPDAKRPLLLVLGDSGEQENLGDLADYVLFRQYIPDEQTVAEYYRAADVLAYATKADNCPLTVLEAMSCGLPVVASSIGGLPELVRDGQTGFLVKPGDAHALCKALYQILTNSSLAQRLAHASEDARMKFNIQGQAENYLMWYQELLEQQARAEKRAKIGGTYANCSL